MILQNYLWFCPLSETRLSLSPIDRQRSFGLKLEKWTTKNQLLVIGSILFLSWRSWAFSRGGHIGCIVTLDWFSLCHCPSYIQCFQICLNVNGWSITCCSLPFYSQIYTWENNKITYVMTFLLKQSISRLFFHFPHH